MSKSVEELIKGMDITTIQWDMTPGPIAFKWMLDYAPRIGMVSLRKFGDRTVAVRIGEPMPAWDGDFR